MLKGITFFLIMIVTTYIMINFFPILPVETKKKVLKVVLTLLGISVFVFILACSITVLF